MKYLTTITDAHVRGERGNLSANEMHLLKQCMGTLLLADIGKRCYLVNGIVQCESYEQRDKRIDGEG